MKRAFISFDYDHDEELRDALVGQAKNPNSPFAIADWSVKEPFEGNWRAKVRDRIRRTDLTIVICGGTHSYSEGSCRRINNLPRRRESVLPAVGPPSWELYQTCDGTQLRQDIQVDLGEPEESHCWCEIDG